jgi:hypothetical protein
VSIIWQSLDWLAEDRALLTKYGHDPEARAQLERDIARDEQRLDEAFDACSRYLLRPHWGNVAASALDEVDKTAKLLIGLAEQRYGLRIDHR